MNWEFEMSDEYGAFDVDASITRETISIYLSAGILFPEEIRRAQQILRRLNQTVGTH